MINITCTVLANDALMILDFGGTWPSYDDFFAALPGGSRDAGRNREGFRTSLQRFADEWFGEPGSATAVFGDEAWGDEPELDPWAEEEEAAQKGGI